MSLVPALWEGNNSIVLKGDGLGGHPVYVLFNSVQKQVTLGLAQRVV